MGKVAISVKGVSKKFLLPHQKTTTFKNRIIDPRNWFGSKNELETQNALSDVSFEVQEGEFFGIVGRNGSGKSTLLKCLAGVYSHDKGGIEVNGSLVPFIELGVGFNPELSGRDNVFLNGSLLGFNRDQMAELYEKIVDFAELEEFMDQKLKNYSSGMQVRLAFSIAIQTKGDILLLDEVLAVGDMAFQKKCNDYFMQLKDNKQTVILVTHSMGAVEQYCDRAMLLESGKIKAQGSPAHTADLYNEMNLRTSAKALDNKNKGTSKDVDHTYAEIKEVFTYNPATGKKQNTFTYKEKIGVKYDIVIHDDIASPTVGLTFKDQRGNMVFATNTPSKRIKLENVKKGQKLTVHFEIDNVFTNANYSLSGAISSSDRSQVYHRLHDVHEFEVGGWHMPNSMIHPAHDVDITYS